MIVSPLVALMQDQVAGMGVSATYITDKEATKTEVKQTIMNGAYQIP